MEKVQKAVGYVRVSTAQQADSGVSLEAQRAKIEAMCVVQGFSLVDVVVGRRGVCQESGPAWSGAGLRDGAGGAGWGCDRSQAG